jgi:hypothetical protein
MAKQGWRLLTSPDIITSRIIKAKYYSHNSIFEANVGKKTILCVEKYPWRTKHCQRRTLLADWQWSKFEYGGTNGF